MYTKTWTVRSHLRRRDPILERLASLVISKTSYVLRIHPTNQCHPYQINPLQFTHNGSMLRHR